MRYGKVSRISLIPLFKTVALANSLNQGCSPSYSRFNTHTGRQHVSSSSQGATTTQITDLCDKGSLIPVNLTDPASLQDQIFDKQPQGIGIHADQGKKDYNQKKRTRTSSQTTQTQPVFLTTDVFVAALGALPVEDWCRTWAVDTTIMLRRTSKRVKEVVDKMHLLGDQPRFYPCLRS
jgi:hypothetical protein